MTTTTLATLAPCCADLTNRIDEVVDAQTIANAAAAPLPGVPSRQRCHVCGRRHYVLRADPGHFGVLGAPMGGTPTKG